jgi:hypothetical protein
MDVLNTAWVEDQIAETSVIWERCSSGAVQQDRPYSRTEQSERERAYDNALEAVERRHQRMSQNTAAGKNGRVEQTIFLFSRFAAEAMDLPKDAIDLLTHDFLPVGVELGQRARRFDPTLSIGEIIQASRNAWTACGLQPLLGERVELTPAIFGYSMIYPYSDNHLDDQTIDGFAKRIFSQRFRRRLCGELVAAETRRERCLWNLISLIEGQYPRELFPRVFESLLLIHRAQEQSIEQLAEEAVWDSESLLRLSCAKGGTSVLADACLVRGSLTTEESRFAFEWGVLLQLGDDLQDLHDDQRRGSKTLFTQVAASGKPLDEVTLQLFRFAQKVGQRMDHLRCGTPTLKQLLKTSWESLILRAIADSHEFFSPAFLAEAEPRSPFRFEFLRSRTDRLASQRGLYAAIFDDFLQEDLHAHV